ncbi:MAG: type II toxin-antitoxin system HicB family antitoxin [Promicromonosporaceae bacterium]|nr:type II toxin-antitoxin system HicB family antitoxin [Promicromonosporaceae bacterium]
MNARRFTYRTRWSSEDQEYVASVAEFPSLSWLAESPNDALTGLMKVVAEVIIDMQRTGEKIPIPFGERDYSGKFVVRIPPEAHRQLAIEAAEQNVSINRLASRRLVSA